MIPQNWLEPSPIATGVWADRHDVAGHWELDRRFEPSMPSQQVETLRARWADAVGRAREWEPR